MSRLAIKVEHLSKAYQLGQIGTGTISRDIERWWTTKVLRKEDPFLQIGQTNDRTIKGDSDIVWSLRDLNFEVEQGEVLGVIGRNGAGKSTLLKLLSRVTAPTEGRIKIKGRIASLLEVGTGFHPELTGLENIYLNGAILGMRKQEIAAKFDEIVAFSGVERYIDTPVKRYSSGMYVRLAFAVAAHLESEILIVDEVLAVGDDEFQKKCLGKMGEVSKGEGKTVLFVSHNLGSVTDLCSKALVLGNGTLLFQGKTAESVNFYSRQNQFDITGGNRKIFFDGILKDEFILKKLTINQLSPLSNWVAIEPSQSLVFEVEVEAKTLAYSVIFSLVIFINGIRLVTIDDTIIYTSVKTNNLLQFEIKPEVLRPGVYTVGFGARTVEDHYLWCSDYCTFEVLEVWNDTYKRENLGILNGSSVISSGKRLS